jgi:phage baseplate assembly protein W
MAIGISPALPLDYDQNDGPFRLTKNIKQAIHQNFKNLILTNPGERMMDPDFGVGIRQYLFELENVGIQQELNEKIHKQVNKYMAKAVQIRDIKYTSGSSYQGDLISVSNSNALYVNILFMIIPLGDLNVLSLPISAQ